MEPSDDGGNVVGFPELESQPKSRKKPERKLYAIDLGLRQRVQGYQVDGEYIVYFCSSDTNDFMQFVLDEDVRVVSGERRVVCGKCDEVHRLITLQQAMTWNELGASSGQDCENVMFTTDHEKLLMNHVHLLERHAARMIVRRAAQGKTAAG